MIDNNNMFSNSMEYFAKMAEKKKRYLEKLEQLPFKQEKFSQQELRRIRGVNLWLKGLLKKIEGIREAHLKNPQLFPDQLRGGHYEKELLDKIFSSLDRWDDIWQCKFSTESQGDGQNLTETPNDSIYYMTHSGASLRFKMANMEKGLAKVIQPFAECLYFDSPEEGLSETPKLGYFTQEYFTREFMDQASSEEPVGQDYQSLIKKYYHDGKFVAAPKNEKIIFDHNGSPVNKIFFEKKK